MRSEIVELLLFQCSAVGTIPVPVLEHRFHPHRKWRFDIAWPIRRIAVEVDGGTWIGGRHVTGVGVEADAEKQSEAAAMGWRVLRLTRKMVEDGRAVNLIERSLAV